MKRYFCKVNKKYSCIRRISFIFEQTKYNMTILILGSGGREHTFAWKISQSPLCKNLYVAPGNSGTTTIAENANISVTDFPAIKSLVLEKNININQYTERPRQ